MSPDSRARLSRCRTRSTRAESRDDGAERTRFSRPSRTASGPPHSSSRERRTLAQIVPCVTDIDRRHLPLVGVGRDADRNRDPRDVANAIGGVVAGSPRARGRRRHPGRRHHDRTAPRAGVDDGRLRHLGGRAVASGATLTAVWVSTQALGRCVGSRAGGGAVPDCRGLGRIVGRCGRQRRDHGRSVDSQPLQRQPRRRLSLQGVGCIVGAHRRRSRPAGRCVHRAPCRDDRRSGRDRAATAAQWASTSHCRPTRSPSSSSRDGARRR